MATRLELQKKLEEMLGKENVYYQPPNSLSMEYPAIVYSKSDVKGIHANNTKYLKNTQYTLTVIDRIPDNPVIDKLLDLPYCSYDRSYKANNLNHDVLILYY